MSQAALCEQYISILYHEIKQQVKSHASASTSASDTYGEILYGSIEQLLPLMRLTSADVFADLGAGVGKLAVQIFLRSQVKEAFGIEYVSSYYQQAMLAAERLKQELPACYAGGRQLNFHLGDFLRVPFSNASVVLICSPCYTQSTLYQLSQLIDQSPRIRQVLSLRPLTALNRLTFKQAVRIQCSWDSALCYIYESSLCE